jgi:hypothetical protein
VVYDGWYRSGDPDGIGDPDAIRARVGALGFNNLGDDRFLHAVQPTVRINSFNPEHDDYAPRQHASFAFAKRLLE